MPEVFIRTPRGYRWPFSKGLVVESLLLLGLQVEAASALAHTLEQKLMQRKRGEIAATSLKKLMVAEVEKQFGPELAGQLKQQTQSFEDIMVRDKRSWRPFSKGIVARSLEGAGFGLTEGYDLGREIEAQLRREGIRRIVAEDLERRIARLLEKRMGRAARRRYMGRIHLQGEIFVEENEGEPRVPFSKGIAAQSIMGVGLTPDQAYRLARELEGQLRQAGRQVVRREELRSLVAELLRGDLGDEMARRYTLLRAVRRSERPIHLLIGGVTGAGKSVFAAALAFRLGITRLISTDVVREILRSTLPRDLIPTLHTSTFDAWMALAVDHQPAEPPEPRLVLQGFRDQVSRIAVGIRALQERAAHERTSMVLEGVHVVPGLLDHPSQHEVIRVPMLLVVEDEAHHQGRFTLRDRETLGSRPRSAYLDRFSDIRLIQEHLAELARVHRIPIISTENIDRALDEGLAVVLEHMEAEARRGRSGL